MSSDNVTVKNDFGLPYDAKDIGKYIRKLRRERKLSMYQLALNTGVTRTVLMRVEKGEREPRVNTLLKIIDGLELRPAEFFRIFD
ncbi:MAG: helix-turn-helix domain-containing protein [Candidatus Margulisbacteria bacterium]|jgi:transcriptional regulator with XRE-family HTH domain|nr:helix-turn-helix domain-containing protein [Candidatus Margulisiibacteriota bacterium]